MGMNKLPLHERLRHWEYNGDGTVSFAARDGKGKVTISGRYHANDLADEIERDYTPKAVDANGKPWEINDACVVYGNDAIVVGYGKPGALFICYENTGKYSEVSADYVKRPEERTSIEKVRDEIKNCAEFREHITYSLLDGWVKELTAYIDQQGKDE